ncbi:hypothetical protein LK542_02250 [Massilia sp. IC2-477]|uniref:sensor histidine kinase n=1 Tax=Massilia sp. IC2-477 TaxID=2887198 RepID=UPI001D10AB6E|nr:hypothetical protein [Massilia sp. IC2-477]MCC2954432.1 hypothetical protein [Massilia sp. IC2-477]
MLRSIRRSLFAALAGFTVLICLGYTGLAVVIAYVTEDMLVGRLLEREARAIEQHAARHGALPRPSSDLVAIHASHASLPAAVLAATTPLQERAEIFTDTGQHYHLLARELPGQGRVYLLADVAPVLVVSKVVQDVGGVLIFVALLLIALALLLAWLLARRLVLPLQVLAREAQALAPGATPAFSARGRLDEIGVLAERLDTSFGALQAALSREHDFTRDVGHELRTPLTVMRNTLVLSEGRALGPEELAQLRSGLHDIGATIDVLFALARSQQLGQENVDLCAVIETCLLRLPGAEDWHEERFSLSLPERLPVLGNRQLAGILLNNCIGNALFHGGPQVVLAIAWENGRLCIANSVDGERRGQVQGFAHGQLLLLRAAQAMGWDIAFHPGVKDYRVEITPRHAA